MAISEEHHRLTGLGAKWFRKSGFGVVATELSCIRSRERPDVIAFRSSCSAIIEVKVSRADFLADLKKPERTVGGLGLYRFYLCPEGLLGIEDLPPRWGLLYANGKNVAEVVKPLGNLWLPKARQHDTLEELGREWREFQHDSNADAEQGALYSIARRLQLSNRA